MKYKLRMEPETVLDLITTGNTAARNLTDDVEWSAEDGSRTEPDFLCRCVEAAIKAGATTINIPDTVGYATPEDMERIFSMLRERVPGAERVIFSAHNHNDLGLAVANTLASVRVEHARLNAPSTVLASVPVTLRWKKLSWPCAPGMTSTPSPPALTRPVC